MQPRKLPVIGMLLNCDVGVGALIRPIKPLQLSI